MTRRSGKARGDALCKTVYFPRGPAWEVAWTRLQVLRALQHRLPARILAPSRDRTVAVRVSHTGPRTGQHGCWAHRGHSPGPASLI